MAEVEHEDNRSETLRALVRGYVQGVGFRVFVRCHAWDLGVKGYVQNLPDGSVKVVASGSHDHLQTLLEKLSRGPAGAHVTSVDTDWSREEPAGLSSSFEVRH
jgi:acylphosphatase